MSKKKQLLRIIGIAAVIVLVVDIGIKLATLIQIKNNYESDHSATCTEFSYAQKTAENPVTDKGVTYDNRFDEETASVVVFNTNTLNLQEVKDELRDTSFLVSFLVTDKSFDKYFQKSGISSVGELYVSAFKDDKSLSVLSAIYPLPIFRQEVIRGLISEVLVPLSIDEVYYSSIDDYTYIIQKGSGEKGIQYIFKAYEKDDSKCYCVVLLDKTGTLKSEEVIDFFETISTK